MKKIFAIILMSTMLLSLAGCSLSTIEIGTKDGKVYFDYPNTTPKITVKRGEEKLPVEDSVFFEKLVNSIAGNGAFLSRVYIPCRNWKIRLCFTRRAHNHLFSFGTQH